MAEIVLYKDDHFRGEQFVTETAVRNLKDVGFNDITSSMLVVSGKWIVYKDADFKGDSWIVDGSGGQFNKGVYLEPSDWGGGNDNISSLQPL